MMYVLAIVLFSFLLLRLLVVIANLPAGYWPAEKAAESSALVSVLIPARNEADKIASLLHQLSFHDYKKLEIIVYDDQSDDETASIVKSVAATDSRIRLIRGGSLPDGWLGKSHACHRLAQQAKGDYLLFLDADVHIKNGLIRSSLHQLRKHKLALLSIFPQQQMYSLAEKISVPLMNWILASLLPLILTRKSAWPAFSAANGQFMLFDAGVYRQHHFHKRVKQHKAEDIAISRDIKKLGFSTQTLLSNGQISCRMYTSLAEAVQGFAKNVFSFFGDSMPTAMLFALIATLGFVPVWMALGWKAMLAYILTGLLIRAMAAVASRQPVWQNLFLAPAQQLMFLWVILTATQNRMNKKNVWKGRKIDLV
jgi:hypothetical protein